MADNAENGEVEHVHPDMLPCLAGCPAYGTRQGPLALPPDQYREQAEAVIADLRARVSHYEALLVAVREQTITRAAADVDALLSRIEGYAEPWDKGYAQGVKDAAYAVRELRAIPPGQGAGA